jgi:hypothetical protein
VHVKGEVVDGEARGEVGQVLEDPVQRAAVDVVRDGHVRVVREVQVPVQRTVPYRRGE